ncbi:MAG TPA: S8 family serine peptidase, partial [Anaeromyxobacter sp.]|nr:S8 family serine peptidase [Anaeromyxobacter sp.]
MTKRFFSAAGRMFVLAGCIALLTTGTALAARPGLPAAAGGALRSASGPVYALVELTAAPTAAQYAQALGRAAGARTATASAVSQLSAVAAQQASFSGALAAAKLPGLTEIYRLQRVYNGILYQVPRQQLARLQSLPGVKAVHIVTPKVLDNARTIPFVNVPALWTNLGLPVHGEGIRVGVIDTGIDYTHANFGGPGTVAAFQAVDPNVATGVFPTAKVVGGFDFAGPIYDAASTETRKITPQPDANPIDHSGHGSHVAGTIAGFGVLANGTTYTGSYDQSFPPSTFRIGPGAAPNALLYALKVFGDTAGS